MARAAPADIEQITRENSVQHLAEARGIRLVRRGAQLVGSCPFHRSHKPTLTISPRANTWACSGKCRIRDATVVEWTMRAEGISRKHAIELLRAGASSSASPSSGIARRSTTRKLDTFAAVEEPDATVLARVVDYYHQRLGESPEACTWLKEHGIRAEVIEHFKIGFADRSLGYRLPEKNRKTGKLLRAQLTRIGILRSTGHEHFRGCVVVPVVDEHGGVQNVYGKRLHEVAGEPSELWLSAEHTAAMFNLGAVRAPMVIITTSILDAIAFCSAGCSSVIAVRDLEVIQGGHLAALRTRGIEDVRIATPRTSEGNGAAEALAPKLAALGMIVHRVVLPHGMSAVDCLARVLPEGRTLETLVRQATWMAGTKPVQEQRTVEQVTSPPPATAAKPEHEVVIYMNGRRWRVRGLVGNPGHERMNVNVMASRAANEGLMHVDTLDMYSARQRQHFAKSAAVELGVDEEAIKHDLGRLLLDLEARQDLLRKASAPARAKPVEMTEGDHEQAMRLLHDPRLLDRLVDDLTSAGIVGEDTNKLVLYLATVSRKLPEPLAVLVQSSSAAGKSSLVDAVLGFVPEEDRLSYSAVTGQALFYAGELGLSHKVLSVSEHEGAREASYALKLLQTEGSLRIASTGKDTTSGRLVAQEYRVQGPVAIVLTTAQDSIDEELLNRCIVLAVDEGQEQTEAIQVAQRQARTLEGLLAREKRAEIQRLHQNVQRLLVPLTVVNPLAGELTFISSAARNRRDRKKYLGLIDAIALLHQHQRQVKTVQVGAAMVRYIEVTREDIALAGKLAVHVLVRDGDDLSPQTQHVLARIRELAAAESTGSGRPVADSRFTRRWLRERLGWSVTRTRVHVERLVQAEYLVRVRAVVGQSTLYRLAPDLATIATCPPPDATCPGGDRGKKSQVSSRDDAELSPPDRVSGGYVSGANGKSSSYPYAGDR